MNPISVSLVLVSLLMAPLGAAATAQASELLGLLTSNLGVTSEQAAGGAGAIFAKAKDNLSADDFGRVADVVPDMGELLAAAPKAASGGSSLLGSATSLLGGSSGGAGKLAGLAGSFTQLGMGGDMVGKFLPLILEYVQTKGGAGVMGLLQGAIGGS